MLRRVNESTHKLAWDSAGHTTKAIGMAGIPLPRLRVGPSLAHLGSHAQPQTNQGNPEWPGESLTGPGDGGVATSTPGTGPQGDDAAQRGNALTSRARGIRAIRKRKSHTHRHHFPTLPTRRAHPAYEVGTVITSCSV